MAGTSYDIVILSSSPPPHYASSSPLNGSPRISPRRVAMPTPPLLAPSPPTSPQKKTSGASAGSRKASIPPDAIRGFATVGSLVRSEHFAQQLNDDPADVQQAQKDILEDTEETTTIKKKPKRRSATASAVGGDAKPKPKSKPKPRKSKADEDTANRDPELRLPAPKTSPYSVHQDTETPIETPIEAPLEPPNEHDDTLPKLTKSGKPRKSRAKKEKAEGDAEPKKRKPRVTKPKGAARVVGNSRQDDACVESAHFRKAADGSTTHEPASLPTEISHGTKAEDESIWEVPQSPQTKKMRPSKQPPPDPSLENLYLDDAVLRRRDWTPPRDTVIASPHTVSTGKENKQIEPEATNGNFTHMISNFAYAQPPTAQATIVSAASATEAMAVTKRRRAELVDIPGNQTNSRNSSPEKGKAPKKKARTITDIATEQYQTKSDMLQTSDVASDFFQSRTTVMSVPLNDVATPDDGGPSKKPPRKRSTSRPDSEKGSSKSKSKKAPTKSTKSKPVTEKLLSPGSAMSRMSKQDILFGTSSQLALEESPTVVREIQVAIKESELEADNSFNELLAPPPHWPKLDKVTGKRNLWDASSRDVEGGLLEQMEDVYIPDFDRTQEFPLLMDGTNDMPDPAPHSFVDIDDIEPPPVVTISSDLVTPPRTTSHASQKMPDVESRVAGYTIKNSVFEDIDDFDSQPPPSNQNAEAHNSFTDIDDLLPASAQLRASPPPKPRPPASTPLTGSHKKRGGRPSKSQSAVPTTSAPPIPMTKPKVSKAKSKKSVSAPPATPPKGSGRFVDIDEILDSEDEAMQALSPTPPRVRSFQDSQPLPLFSTSPTRAKKTTSKTSVDPNIVPIHRIPVAHLEWGNFKSQVYSSITAHIRSLLPTTDTKKPSWHEKILMYDPIVLEEFTAYLNANSSIRTWKRATKISIKAWNKEMKAVGREAAFVVEGGDEVLAVEKELEAWQVQGWCESMSVCCIWGEGRGKSGVRKGFY